jgi:hypothetical protein
MNRSHCHGIPSFSKLPFCSSLIAHRVHNKFFKLTLSTHGILSKLHVCLNAHGKIWVKVAYYSLFVENYLWMCMIPCTCQMSISDYMWQADRLNVVIGLSQYVASLFVEEGGYELTVRCPPPIPPPTIQNRNMLEIRIDILLLYLDWTGCYNWRLFWNWSLSR